MLFNDTSAKFRPFSVLERLEVRQYVREQNNKLFVMYVITRPICVTI